MGLQSPKGVDPQVVKIRYDAFGKGMEDPIHLQVLEKHDQDLVCMSAEACAKFAQAVFKAEKAPMERLIAQQK